MSKEELEKIINDYINSADLKVHEGLVAMSLALEKHGISRTVLLEAIDNNFFPKKKNLELVTKWFAEQIEKGVIKIKGE